jgi:hypothetical protein
MSNKILFGFHAVTVRLKTTPKSVVEIHIDTSRATSACASSSSVALWRAPS